MAENEREAMCGLPVEVRSTAGLGVTRDEVVSLARAAGVNGEPAGPNGDGIESWYGNQYLPSGALTKLVGLAMISGIRRALAIAEAIHAEAADVAHPDAEVWTAECVKRILDA